MAPHAFSKNADGYQYSDLGAADPGIVGRYGLVACGLVGDNIPESLSTHTLQTSLPVS